MEYTVTKENFEAEVLGADKPVIVDFWATWCGPCMMLAPVLEEFAAENEGKVKVCKINVDEQPELAIGFKVNLIPTLMVFKDGKPVKTSKGVISKEEMAELVK